MLLICKLKRWIRSHNQLKQCLKEDPSRMIPAERLVVMKSLIFHTEAVSVEEDAIYVWNAQF